MEGSYGKNINRLKCIFAMCQFLDEKNFKKKIKLLSNQRATEKNIKKYFQVKFAS